MADSQIEERVKAIIVDKLGVKHRKLHLKQVLQVT